MQMELIETPEGPLEIQLTGRLDAAGAEAIGLRYTAAVVGASQSAIVDLSAVGFVASLGIRLLVSAAKAARLKGRRMVLFAAQPEVQDTFEQAALEQILDITDSRAAALALIAD